MQSLRLIIDKYLPAIIAGVLAFLGSISGQPGTPPPPPAPPIVTPPPAPDVEQPSRDIEACIVKLKMPGSYCSGTIINPRNPDGRYRIVSAAHCVGAVGDRMTILMRDGRTFQGTWESIDKTADVAIVLTDPLTMRLPYALVSDQIPAAGSEVWHAGFGVDVPGNRETGKVTAAENSAGQVRYRISVSPGDSGGGIIATADGKLISPVCCTTCLGCVGDVWGASPARIHRLLSTTTSVVDLPPAVMPMPPKE